jgi:serine/threonine-protein kinase RsbW
MEEAPQIRLPATLESLPQFIAFVSSWAGKEGFEERQIMEIELATEEALVNIIRYAYGGAEGDIEIACAHVDDRGFVITIADSGSPFNPLLAREPDLSADISERQIGGLGIFLLRKFIKDVEYERTGGKNILSFVLPEKKDL